jgi:hypothetical protein
LSPLTPLHRIVCVSRQSIQLSDEGHAGDVVFIARDPVQPLTEEVAARFATRQVFIQAPLASALENTGALPAPGEAGVRMMAWNAGSQGSTDQYLIINGTGDEMKISLGFTDAPLSMILEPLANMAVIVVNYCAN